MAQQIAVVTGANSGFGKRIAEGLAAAGYRTFGTVRDSRGRNAAGAAALAANGVEVVELDVTDQRSVDAAAAHVLGAAGAPDVLVNNAGTVHNGLFEAFTPESVERQFATNVVGPHRLDRAFLPGMRERGSGLVVFVSSLVGRLTAPFMGPYAASKFALEAMAEILSYELRPFGVDVAIVEPGAYATEIMGKFIGPDDEVRVASYGATAKIVDKLGEALSAAGDPQEVADAVIALIRQPAGTRPLRTALPAASPTTAVNAAVAPIQHATIEAFGLGELLPKEPAAVS